MDRRRILLIVAVVVALLGTTLVYLYVRGSDQRANDRFETVEVLRAVAPIEVGESLDDAAASGKLALQPVPQDYLMPNYQTSTDGLSGSFATQAIYPGEQIVSDKFGTEVEVPTDGGLDIPKGMIAISVTLSDTARVAGFIKPGTEVAVFHNGAQKVDVEGSGNLGAGEGYEDYTRLLLEAVQVIAVGSTATTETTTVEPDGTQVVEQLPSTLLTLAVPQRSAEKVLFAQKSGELVFALKSDPNAVNPGPGMTADGLFR